MLDNIQKQEYRKNIITTSWTGDYNLENLFVNFDSDSQGHSNDLLITFQDQVILQHSRKN